MSWGPNFSNEEPPKGLSSSDEQSWRDETHRLRIHEHVEHEERERRARLGAGPPPPPSGDGTVLYWIAKVAVALFLFAAAAFAVAVWITVHAAGYRDLLEKLLPGDWIASAPGQEGKPGSVAIAVGGVFALGVVGLTIARRVGTRRWVAGESGVRFVAWCAVTTFLRTLLLVAAGGLIAAAAQIAKARDLEDPATGGLDGWTPWILTFAIVTLLSVGSTRRAIRKARARSTARQTGDREVPLNPPEPAVLT